MIYFMLILVILTQFYLYISLVGTTSLKHKTDVRHNNLPSSTAQRASLITSSIASHMINGLSGRALDLSRLMPRDDKIDDIFFGHEFDSLGNRKDEHQDDEVEWPDRHKSAINRLALGDLTKTVEYDQLDNNVDEPELVVNNHQVTVDPNAPTASNSRHFINHHLNPSSSSLFANGHHHSYNSHQYGKYSPNMFANNYNLKYIHSFLTSKPSSSSSPTSLSLQTMQSLLNSNPNGLTLSSYGTSGPPLSSTTGGGSYVSSAAFQPTNINNVRGQPLPVQQYSLVDNKVEQQNSTASLTADLSSYINCGRQQVAFREPRIVGGNKTYEGEFPWAVSIQRHGNHHCGGVIVGHRWILTAAHCVRSQLVGNLVVRTGGHTLTRSINSLSGHLEKDFPVEQIIMHEDFSRYDNLTSSQMKSSANTNNADIALLKLKQEIHWNEHAWPVCFPNREAGNFSGHDAIVIGWGKLNEKSEEFSNELQKVKLTIIDNKVCQNWFRQAGRDMLIDDRIICAGFKNGGKDACHGDSGGPLLSRHNGQYVVVGVVSTGIGCARPLLPGLYSRVSSYIGWIEKHMTN